jgi:hypothetical protein
VASGRATTDGRPLLWKTRDAGATNNEVIWNTSGTYPFVSVISAGDQASSWMGVNEKGFAIINTLELQDENGDGIWKITLPVEDSIIAESERALDSWRTSGVDTAEMLETKGRMARKALEGIKRAYECLLRSY